MKKTEILAIALSYIKSGKKEYICEAIREVCDENWSDENDYQANELIIYIQALLEGYGTLEGWLKNKGYSGNPAKILATRIAWMEWMILDWKGKEHG